jgi:DME family drug/metabolite transporter
MTKPSSSTPRLLIVAAAVLWSLSALFVRLLQEPLGLGLDTPRIDPLVIAAYRSLFAGLMLLPFVPMADMRIRLPTAGAALCFGAMSGLYLMALGHGAAANAILLKYTAPLWVALATVALTGERLKLRNLAGVLVGVFGTAVIVVGNWPRDGHPARPIACLA